MYDIMKHSENGTMIEDDVRRGSEDKISAWIAFVAESTHRLP